MGEMEFELFDAVEAVTDALADGHPITSEAFMIAALNYGKKPVYVDRLIMAIRREFCNGIEPG